MRPTSHEDAIRTAERAIRELGHSLAEHELLTIQCHRNHHVGAVYATAAGPVVRTRTGTRSRGHRDFYDGAHGDAERGRYVDLLDPVPGGAGNLSDDPIPGWCACGGWSLSRRAVREGVSSRTRTWRIPED